MRLVFIIYIIICDFPFIKNIYVIPSYHLHDFFIEFSPPPSSFSVSWGAIVDAFIVNGVRYGKSSQAPSFKSYSLNPGETLNEVKYGVGLKTTN